jgi:MFS family permease
MNAESRRIRNVYLVLSQFIWLPTSLIVGVNTLFLLDGGLNNVEAFAANAIYTLGLVLFEIPTGMVADTWGRRTSYLLGAGVQLVGNLVYVWMWYTKGPFWGWSVASLLLGCGYTFFSGALEAWLVDALEHAGYDGDLDPIFAKNQIVTGAAMLVGTVAGGFIAQVAALGTPYLVRAGFGKVADTAGYAASYLVSGSIAVLGLPFLLLARRENVSADLGTKDGEATKERGR